MTKNKIQKVALILAGGVDNKFWPSSTVANPEQFVSLLNDATLFQSTYKLVNGDIAAEDIWLIINEKYKHLALEQVSELDSNHIITEPLSRHTAPAVGLALVLLEDKYPDDAIFCIFPSDQYIKNKEEFYHALNVASNAAAELDGLITIGIEPNRPDTHYGYIQYIEDNNFANNDEQYDDSNYKNNYKNSHNSDNDNNSNSNSKQQNQVIPKEFFNENLRKSINFAEKPNRLTAQRFIESGDFVWNSGIVIAKKGVFIKAFQRFMNYHYEQFKNLQNYINTENYREELDKIYRTFNKISIDYGILENADNVYVVKANFSWTDLNDWDELSRISFKDASGNVLTGNVIAWESTNSFVKSNDRLVALIGMEDVIVINDNNVLLVCKKEESHKVDELVRFIKKKNIPFY